MNKTSPLTRTLSSLKVLSCAMLAATALNSANAATGTWTATSGEWNTTNSSWTGVTGTPWDFTNGPTNTANFTAASGSASVNGTVYANQINYTAGTGAFTINNGNITLAGTTPAISVNPSRTLTIGSVLAGTDGLIKNGTGTLTLTANNTYTGMTTINAGTLGLGGSGNNTIGGNITIAGGQLIYSNTSNSQIAVTSNVTLTSGTFNVFQRTQTINSLNMSGGTLNATSSANLTLSSASSFTGGTVNMGGSNGGTINTSATGATTLGNVTFDYNHIGSQATTSGLVLGGNITVADNSTANFTNSSANATNKGNVRVNAVPGATTVMTVGNNSTLNMGWTLFFGNATTTLTKEGNGTLVISGSSPVSSNGTILINTGNVTLTGGNATGDNQRIQFGNATGAVLYVAQSEQLGSIASLGTNSGNIIIAENQTLTATYSTNATTFGGTISGNNAGLTKTQTTVNGTFTQGTLTLTGNNTYTGATTVAAGTLALSGAGALSDDTAVNITGGSFSISAITSTGETIGSLAGAAGTTVVLGNKTLTTANNDSTTFSGVISSTGTGGGLTKNGTGTLTLNGSNTYTGATRINGGILALGSAGSIATSSNLTIAAGAEFDVTSKTAFTLSAPLTIEVGAAGAGRVDATGISLTYGGPLTLNITTSSPLASYDLFDFTTQSGNFNSISLTGSFIGVMSYNVISEFWSASFSTYDFTYDKSSGILTATAVPEQSTWVLIGIGAAFFLYRMGRKKLFAREQN